MLCVEKWWGFPIYRANILSHELGHLLGLDHWAGPGTMMSYAGYARENVGRLNLCGPYSRNQLDSSSGTGLAGVLVPQCDIPEMDGRSGTDIVGRQRMNNLSCTDVRRIRAQVADVCDGSEWCETQPLHCELRTERTEYAGLETPLFDSVANEAYFGLDFDMRFAHCGASPQFSRLEAEFFQISPTHRDPVQNEYEEIVGHDPVVRVNDTYVVPMALESRKLLNAVPTASAVIPGMDVYPSFRDQLVDEDSNGNGILDPGEDSNGNRILDQGINLGVVVKAYANADLNSGGVREEFLAASTGFLRSPVLTPVDTQLIVEVSQVKHDGNPVGSPMYSFTDYVESPDLFPFIDDAMLKPNVGKVLYVVVPNLDYNVEFKWTAPDLSFAAGAMGPAKIWVDAIQIDTAFWPTIEDWVRAEKTELFLRTPADLPNLQPAPPPAHGDPCLYDSGMFELPALTESEEPLERIEGVNAWHLYRVGFDYKYVHYGEPTDTRCTPDVDVCTNPGVCTRTADSPFGSRHADFYINILGPAGDIIFPPQTESVCLIDAERSPNSNQNRFAIRANVKMIKTLANYLGGLFDYDVQLQAYSSKVREKRDGPCASKTYETAWTDAESLDTEGILTLDPIWENNCRHVGYDVMLKYHFRPRYRSVGWIETVLDRLRVRIEHEDEECDAPDNDYEIICSPWNPEYQCPWE